MKSFSRNWFFFIINSPRLAQWFMIFWFEIVISFCQFMKFKKTKCSRKENKSWNRRIIMKNCLIGFFGEPKSFLLHSTCFEEGKWYFSLRRKLRWIAVISLLQVKMKRFFGKEIEKLIENHKQCILLYTAEIETINTTCFDWKKC